MKNIVIGLIVGIILTFGGHALAATNVVDTTVSQLFTTTGNTNTSINHGEVYKFKDGKTICYTYTKGGISCVK